MFDFNKFEETILGCSNVIITAHKNLDLDAFGALLSMYFICEKMNKKVSILIDDIEFESGVEIALKKIVNLNYKVDIEDYKNILNYLDRDSLLILLDTNKKTMSQNEKVFEAVKKVMVIDHHIKEEDYNIISIYEYINYKSSSTCEIVLDIIKRFNVVIPEYVATVMLAGIIIDTNNFYLKTTKNTYYCAGYLKELGADITEMQYLLKQDFNDYVDRQKVIENTRFINSNVAISVGEENKIYENEEIAKMADSILLFKNVEASFVIGKLDSNRIGISARSLGKINVQEVMEKLGGGGHLTDAATQIDSNNLNEVKENLLNLLKSIV